jgi:dihydrodipicolinate synthase/N-acetylneuraminate lyase
MGDKMEIIIDLITPYDENNEVSKELLLKIIDKLIIMGCKNILFFGFCGEYKSITKDEVKNNIEYLYDLYNEKINIFVYLDNDKIELIKDLISYHKLNIIVDLESIDYIKDFSNNSNIYLYSISNIDRDEILKLMNNNNFKGLFIDRADNNDLNYIKNNYNEKIIISNDTKIIIGMENDFSGILSVNANIDFEKLNELINLQDFEILELIQKKYKIAYEYVLPLFIRAYYNELIFNIGNSRKPLEDIHFYEYECILRKYINFLS